MTRPRVHWLALGALALAALACNALGEAATDATGSPLPPTVTPDTSQTQTGSGAGPTSSQPTQLPICTPPACAPGEAILCQQAQGCPLGCGVVCGVPSATPVGGPTATVFSPPSAPQANAEFEGIAFYFTYGVTPEWKVEVVPAEALAAGAPEAWLKPSHYAFTFPKYPVSSAVQPPRILIFPIKNFEGYNQTGLDAINRLKKTLAERPANFDMANPIPMIPIFNAGQMFQSQVAYMSFQNGSGIRFVTQLAQAPVPIVNGETFYTFQGITNDGLYAVAAFFPISHPSLPTEVSDPAAVVGSDPLAYQEGVEAALNAATAGSFTPSLATLDQMMQSLKVK